MHQCATRLRLSARPGRERALDGAGRPLDRERRGGAGADHPPELAGLLAKDKPLDRTSVNSWEDTEFIAAVGATGRRKLIFCAL